MIIVRIGLGLDNQHVAQTTHAVYGVGDRLSDAPESLQGAHSYRMKPLSVNVSTHVNIRTDP